MHIVGIILSFASLGPWTRAYITHIFELDLNIATIIGGETLYTKVDTST